MLETLPHIHADQHSMVTGRSASVMSNATAAAHGADGQKLKSIKFVYSAEVLRCFQRVLRHLDDNVVGSAGPIKVDNAGRFYKPTKSDIQIVKFPTIYGELLSMRRRKHTDPELYVRTKVAECSRHEPEEFTLPLKQNAAAAAEDNTKRGRKMSVVKMVEREATSTSINAGLPTIFELTHAQTPRNKVKKSKGKLLAGR